MSLFFVVLVALRRSYGPMGVLRTSVLHVKTTKKPPKSYYTYKGGNLQRVEL